MNPHGSGSTGAGAGGVSPSAAAAASAANAAANKRCTDIVIERQHGSSLYSWNRLRIVSVCAAVVSTDAHCLVALTIAELEIGVRIMIIASQRDGGARCVRASPPLGAMLAEAARQIVAALPIKPVTALLPYSDRPAVARSSLGKLVQSGKVSTCGVLRVVHM